jgi:acyl-CoA thioester hydrolase
MKDSTLRKKIYYHDTDCGGVVYYANYLKYFEEGRTEFYAAAGISMKELMAQGYAFVVARVEVEYKRPVRYQDAITVRTSVGHISASSIRFDQEVASGDVRAVAATTTLVCVDRNLKPVRIPDAVRNALAVEA